MRSLAKLGVMLGLVGLGYVLGISGHPADSVVRAQAGFGSTDLTPETLRQIKNATDALQSASAQLAQEGSHVPATEGINAFAVMVGGVDAIDGLESGQGVDPETFAALYAGLAIPEVQDHLEMDADGRLLYKNKVVRLYSISRLKQLYAERERIAAGGLE